METIMLDTHRLKIFISVAELKSFSKAAKELYLTQPTVSQHITTLESFLGITLLNRTGKGILLTNAGNTLYKYAKQIIDLTDEALQSIELLKGKKTGNLTLGASTIPGEFILPNILGNFKKDYPEIKISIKISDTQKIINDLLEHSIEIGVIGAKVPNPKLTYTRFLEDELILAVPKNHKWWNLKGKIEISDLIKEPFILREDGSGTLISMAATFKKLGLEKNELNIVSEVGSTTAVKQSIKAGLGISLVSERALSEELKMKTLKKIPIKDIRFTRTFYIIRNKQNSSSPLGQAFFKFLTKQK